MYRRVVLLEIAGLAEAVVTRVMANTEEAAKVGAILGYVFRNPRNQILGVKVVS